MCEKINKLIQPRHLRHTIPLQITAFWLVFTFSICTIKQSCSCVWLLFSWTTKATLHIPHVTNMFWAHFC